MPTPRDALRRQVHDIVHRHLIRPIGTFRADQLVDDLVNQLHPDAPTAADDLANARRLAWFTDDELRAELNRRRATVGDRYPLADVAREFGVDLDGEDGSPCS